MSETYNIGKVDYDQDKGYDQDCLDDLYTVKNLSAGYGDKTVIEDFNFNLKASEIVGIIGPNGCGKSTLFKAITGLLPLNSGNVYINGKDLKSLSRKKVASDVSYVSQINSSNFSFTVREVIEMGRYPHLNIWDKYNPNDYAIIDDVIKQTDLESHVDSPISELSGGEQQRVYLARSLAQNTQILLLDEPTLHLDIFHQLKIFKILEKLCIEKKPGILCILHDINLALKFCHRLIVISNGKILAQGPTNVVLNEEIIEIAFSTESKIIQDPEQNCPTVIFK